MTKEEKRLWVRENLPVCAEIAREFADAFGPEVRMVYANEAGHCYGSPGPKGFPMSQMVIGSMKDYR